MSINSYLTSLANSAIIRDTEKVSIQRSISRLQTNLARHFGAEIKNHFIFGSYTRGTILPRNMDSNSDIDYMIVFRDASNSPQTYLNKLRRFVEIYYSRSDIFQSHPTIVLSLNHIKFELVPATENSWWMNTLQIPARRSDFTRWIDTDPNNFNRALTNANQENQNLIKPMIRLVKYWNAKNNYLFPSFELEKYLAERSYFHIGGFFGCGQLKDYFIDAVQSLDYGWEDPQYKKNAIIKTNQIIDSAKNHIDRGYDNFAENEIKKLFT